MKRNLHNATHKTFGLADYLGVEAINRRELAILKGEAHRELLSLTPHGVSGRWNPATYPITTPGVVSSPSM